MRRLDHVVQNALGATINLGAQVDIGTSNMEPTKTPSLWAKIWNERDVQIMVLISLALQLFLLFAGNIRRWRRVGWLRFLVWLAYLASFAVAASAINLFSQYEGKYKLRSRESFEHLHTLTLPFLWPPILLLHFGGPDTITAFSLEDNNLWTRQMINLVFQLALALYVFWKSFDLLDRQLLAVAAPLFVAGIIKYGERIWAFQRGSRDGLDHHPTKEDPKKKKDPKKKEAPPCDVVTSCALKSALGARGLLVGRTLVQLGSEAEDKILYAFPPTEPTEKKVKIVLTELGMTYDMLYTKAMVLHSLTGGALRCVALVALVVAFVLFWVNQHMHAHKTANATYTLLVAAISVEVYSFFMVIASPWTMARSKHGTILCWLSRKLSCCFPSQWLSSPSMGQFNLIEYSLSKKYKVCEALGLEKHRRNFWHVKYVNDEVLVNYILELFNTSTNPSDGGTDEKEASDEQGKLKPGKELKVVLSLPFEHAIFHLHIWTEIHLRNLLVDDHSVLVAECRKLSNYLMYLMTICPSMLPVSSAVRDFQRILSDWVRDNHPNLTCNLTKEEVQSLLAKYAEEELKGSSPFRDPPSGASLQKIKEVWARLLIYAAGKCPLEEHARQLGNGGGELLAVVGSVMMHRQRGDVGEKVELAPAGLLPAPPQPAANVSLRPNDPEKKPSVLSQPLYAFEFDDSQEPTSVKPLSLSLHNQTAPTPEPPGPSAPTPYQPVTSGGTDEIEETGW